MFNEVFSQSNLIEPSYKGYKKFYSTQTSPQKQHRILLRRNFLHGPTFFIKKDMLFSVGGFDETYKFEDLPIALKLTEAGVKLYFMEKVTVFYRIHDKSITRNIGVDALFSQFYKERYRFEKQCIFTEASWLIRWCKKYEYYRHYFMDKLGLNKNNLFCRMLYRVTLLLNPLNMYNLFF
jgi:GT2 family glycosyltransferase